MIRLQQCHLQRNALVSELFRLLNTTAARGQTDFLRRVGQGTIYVHWPFCSQLCSYCNFNKYVREHVDQEGMTKCLVREIQSLLKLSRISEVTSIYFGGGTPSLAKPSTVEGVIEKVTSSVHLVPNAEVTLEANPTSAEIQRLRDFRTAGVTRLSLGVQSLNNNDLQLLNRDHSVEEALGALSEACKLFPGKTNVDLIFGRPGQTYHSWVRELEEILNVCDSHVSLYQLTVECGTPLATSVKNGELILPKSDVVADMYETAVEVLEGSGLMRYEVSNFAKPGSESQHNLSYWTGRDYVGVGPDTVFLSIFYVLAVNFATGAHSRFLGKGLRTFIHSVNTLEPTAWMKKVNSMGHGVVKLEHLTALQRLQEVIATCLRTTEGLTNQIWKSFVSTPPLQEVFSSQNSDMLRQLYQTEMLTLDNRGIRATVQGLNVLDSLLPELLLVLEDHVCETS